MNRTLFVLIFAVLALQLPTCRAEEKSDKSLLWRVTGKNSAHPSYVFGTIHLLCPGDFLWTDAMKKSLSECGKVCFEMDMDDPNVLKEASTGLMATSGKQLQDYFTASEYGRLRQFMHDSLGVDVSDMQTMKPIVLATILMARLVNCAIPVSYEANIMEKALKDKKEIVGLEDVQEQLALFDNVPDDSAAIMLINLTDSFASTRQEYAKMLALYRAQDLPSLYELVKTSKELGEQMGAFLDERNKKWVPRMEAKMKMGPVFFAVGAAHLYGEPGLITLLRKRGFTVTPVL